MSTVPLDLTDLASVRQCGQLLLDQGADFDVVLNNAGVEGRGLDRAEALQHSWKGFLVKYHTALMALNIRPLLM